MEETQKPATRAHNASVIIFLLLIALDIFGWIAILFRWPSSSAHTYFLNVETGSSALMIWPHNIKILVDAGPDGTVVNELGKILPDDDHYIDLAIILESKTADFTGYNYLLDAGYRFGAFVYNGRDAGPNVPAWSGLMQNLRTKNIPIITVLSGDSIISDTEEDDIFSPDRDFDQSPDLDDTSIGQLIKTPDLNGAIEIDEENGKLRAWYNKEK